MREITYLQAIQEALAEEMRRDESVFLLGEDIAVHGGAFGLTKGLVDEFGTERIRDTPISENTIAGVSLGAALTGMRPVLEYMFADFSALAYDQIVNQIAKVRYMFGGQSNAPLVIRFPQGGLSWKSAGANHAQTVDTWYAHIPGLLVVTPSNPYDAKGLLKSAIRDNNPVMFLEHKGLYQLKGEVPEEEYLVPLGEADVKRPGNGCTIVANGMMLRFALEAAETLASEGVDVEVVDVRSLRPLDIATIMTSVKKTHRAVVVTEGVRTGSVATDWAARIFDEGFDWLDAPVKVLAGAEVPVPYADVLETHIWPRPHTIAEAVREVCYV
jgi:pyruvate/2-oxoglutarate/acetoin dehydrogenase E1 component